MKPTIPTTLLSDDYRISWVIKGNWQLAGGHGFIDRKTAITDMFRFVEAGITTFDCADIYTGVEELIGEFLGQYRRRYGKNSTRNIKIHTKCVPDLGVLPHMTMQYMEKLIDRSLMRLGVDQLDLVQFHWWDFSYRKYVEAAVYLEYLQRSGKIRLLGLTNFDVYHLAEIVDTGVNIVSNQVQYSLLDHRPENGMTSYCLQHNIRLLCYGTVAGGFLSEKYMNIPEPTGQLENRSLTKYKLIIEEYGGWDVFQALLDTLQAIGMKHHVDIATIAMRYVLEKPSVAGIIVGVRDRTHLDSLTNLCTFLLDNDDYQQLSEITSHVSGPKGDIYSVERVKNGPHAAIMKYNLNKVE